MVAHPWRSVAPRGHGAVWRPWAWHRVVTVGLAPRRDRGRGAVPALTHLPPLAPGSRTSNPYSRRTMEPGDGRGHARGEPRSTARRRATPTSTRAFGVGARESHDASVFYARFQPKQISTDDEIAPPFEIDRSLVCGDSRSIALPDNSVALVVTSPPYFAGKEYEEALGQGVIPATYAAYLELLCDVFRECLRVLEPGGRMAINVANLGRRPYRSLSADVVRILDDDLGMLLRGEIIWKKAEGASGSCAWGSYRSPSNPVLRDITERVVVASKGRFDRAPGVESRRTAGRPHVATISTEEFLDATLDVWDIRPESAPRVRHPAPFPVELPQRLIELYTFHDDLVVDPFLGSGTTAVAALRTGRRFVGYDTDAGYLAIAEARVAEERERLGPVVIQPVLSLHEPPDDPGVTGPDPATPEGTGKAMAHAWPAAAVGGVDGVLLANPGGKAARLFAADLVSAAGFTIVALDRKVPGVGVTVDIEAEDRHGARWHFDVTGAFTTVRGGLLRADVLWRCLGRVGVLAALGVRPVVCLTTELPPRRSSGDLALRAVGPGVVHDVVHLLDGRGHERLARYAAGAHSSRPLPGFWAAAELSHAP